MSEYEIKKNHILTELRGLCAHCSTGASKPHHCPVQELTVRITSLRGVPLIVNSKFKGLLWNRA